MIIEKTNINIENSDYIFDFIFDIIAHSKKRKQGSKWTYKKCSILRMFLN